ncbi:MAG: ATP-binding cassette domain-containing protein [Acidimicrobiales bacterium]|jgi:ABC-type branched-subunit amino acid transport system ATPase component/ABC-type branched-subunit amino acid transport system permease subunit|nr:ATP-binding cassette domain-containing protein [Acidimicrobiales bacterium]
MSDRRGLVWHLLTALPFVALFVFLFWFASAQSEDRYWMQLGVQALWIAMVVMGVNLLLGYTGLLSLGHWAFFLYGGFIGAIWAVSDWGLSPWLGFPVAFVAGLGMGAVLALTCCHLRGFYLTVMTLAFGLLAASLAVLFDGAFNGFTGRGVTQPLDPEFGFLDKTPNRAFVGLFLIGSVLLAFCLYVSWNLVHSRWGRAYQAIRESELAAGAAGVPTYWTKVSAFAISAGMVALAGVLAAQTNLQVTMADGTSIVGQSFKMVIYAFFGGLGTIAGPVVGAFAFTLGTGVEIGGESSSERLGEWETLYLGAMVIVLAIVLPTGIVGTLRKAVLPRLARLRPTAPPARDVELRPAHEHEAGSVLLSLEGVTQRFGGLVALDGIDLEVRVGSVHALIGPNGSGKTTLANVTTGIYHASGGQVRLAGEDLVGASPHRCTRRGVARTFQTCHIWRQMTVLDNVLVGAHTRSRTGLVRSCLLPPWLRPDERRLRREAWDLLHLVGLADHGYAPAGSLPFVDQRRLEIARALAARPDLLILDEPAAGMHPQDVAELIALIAMVRDAGVTVLLIEHHMEVVLGLADRVTVLDFGHKLAEGTAQEVAANQAVIDAYLGAETEQVAEEPTTSAGAVAAVAAGSAPGAPSSPTAEPLLRVHDLTVRYGAATALHGIDLEVFDHEIVSLVGANGAGKTTTLEAIAGVSPLLMAVDGEVTFAGRRIDRLPAQKIARLGLALVPEGRWVFPESTVEENLRLGAYRRRDSGGVRDDIEAAYERFPVLGERRRQPAGLLSGGEQQMLAIARALVGRPRFLLLDEPSLGLAPNLSAEIFAAIRRLADEGIPILLVEQRAAAALAIADRAYVLETGRIVTRGRAADLAHDEAVRVAYLGG